MTEINITTENPVIEFIIPSEIVINGGTWGAIDGDIDNQLDLIAELDLKEDAINKVQNLDNPDSITYPSTDAIATALSLIDQALSNINNILSGKQDDLGYTAENIANKVTNLSVPDNITYPTTQAITIELSEYSKTINFANVAFSGNYADLSGIPSSGGHTIQDNGNSVVDRENLNFLGNITITDNLGNNSTDISFEAYQLALDYTPENVDNKATNLTNPDDITYPTTNAIVAELSSYSTTDSFANIAFSGNYSDINNKPTIPSSHTQLTDIGNNSHSAIDIALTRLANTSGVNTGDQDLSGKQDLLISGTNIKTINNNSLLGSGNIDIVGIAGSIASGQVAFGSATNTLAGNNSFIWNNIEQRLQLPYLTIGSVIPGVSTNYQMTVSGGNAGIYLQRSGGSEPFIFVYGDVATSGGQIRGILSASGGLKFTNYAANIEYIRFIPNGAGINNRSPSAQLDIVNSIASQSILRITQAVSQSAKSVEFLNSSGVLLSSFDVNYAWNPPSVSNANAVNNSIFNSTDNGKLSYKNESGVVNVLYDTAFINTGNIATQITTLSSNIYYNGNSAINLSANPQIVAGIDGQKITIVGSSDTNTITLNTGNGLKLNGGLSITLGSGDTLQLIYSSTLNLWLEINRSDNN